MKRPRDRGVLCAMLMSGLAAQCASDVRPIFDAAAIDSGATDGALPVDGQTTLDAVEDPSGSDTSSDDGIPEGSVNDSSADAPVPDVPPGAPVNHRASNPPCGTATGTCLRDADCTAGNVCACVGTTYASPLNTCVPSNCTTDADCGPGGWCSPSETEGGACARLAGYFCHTPSDTCTNDVDCPGHLGNGHCISDGSAWQCGHSFCD
jgi:hypothetical protein